MRVLKCHVTIKEQDFIGLEWNAFLFLPSFPIDIRSLG